MNLWPLQVELSWKCPFLQQAVLCTWQRQSIISQGSCLCALKPFFGASEGTAFPMSLVLVGTMWQGPEPLLWFGPALCWDGMRCSLRLCPGSGREGACAGFTSTSYLNFIWQTSIPLSLMCNHRFFSQMYFYLDDEGSCKPGTLPHEFTRVPFIK